MAAWRDGSARRPAFRNATDGSVAIEYGLIAALVVVVIIVTLVQVRTNLLSLPFPALIAAFTNASS
ncbi:MAG: Flp family type IVb pilin [Rhizobiales bacterium]|nr:Flp family type IVb pilin [Hyphomicrobiales bacterium]